MVLSDRRHAAQVRYTPAEGSRSQVYEFDDIGCAVLWLEGQSWREHAGIEIWVTDHRNGKWIDARSAYYVSGQRTPMEYGLGAQREAAPGAMTFAEAQEHVHELEKRHHIRGAHQEHHGATARVPTMQDGSAAAER
jgi:hypothetical protein